MLSERWWKPRLPLQWGSNIRIVGTQDAQVAGKSHEDDATNSEATRGAVTGFEVGAKGFDVAPKDSEVKAKDFEVAADVDVNFAYFAAFGAATAHVGVGLKGYDASGPAATDGEDSEPMN